MKPIAIDLGRAFWVMARTDVHGQPEVASIGDGGLIPAVISEFGDELLFGQLLDDGGGTPPLRDFYRLLDGQQADLKAEFQQRLRESHDGEVEIFIGGQWQTPTALLTQLLFSVVQVVKEHLSPNAALPVVAAIPPRLDARVLYRLRKAISDSGLLLAAWCPAPIAQVFCEAQIAQHAETTVLTAHMERGALTLGVVEAIDGFPSLRACRSISWSPDLPLPLEDAQELLDKLLLYSEEQAAIYHNQIDTILISGEEAWISHLYPILQERVQAQYLPFSRPHLAVAMGASLMAERLQEGFCLAPTPLETSKTQLSLRGFTIPEASLQIKGGPRETSLEVDLYGEFELLVPLHQEQNNLLELSLFAPDGRRFLAQVEVQQSANAYEDMDNTTQLPGKQSAILAPVGLQIGERSKAVTIIPPLSPIPLKRTCRFQVQKPQAELLIVQCPTPEEPRTGVFGRLSLKQFQPYLKTKANLQVEFTCSQPNLLEVTASVEGFPQSETNHSFHLDNCQWLSDRAAARSNGASSRAKSSKTPGKKMSRRDKEESTQPDMEVPPELLDAAEAMSISVVPPPGQGGIPPAQEAELPEESGFFEAPPASIGSFSAAEGDGSTMVFSRDSLFAVTPRGLQQENKKQDKIDLGPSRGNRPPPPPAPRKPAPADEDIFGEVTVIGSMRTLAPVSAPSPTPTPAPSLPKPATLPPSFSRDAAEPTSTHEPFIDFEVDDADIMEVEDAMVAMVSHEQALDEEPAHPSQAQLPAAPAPSSRSRTQLPASPAPASPSRELPSAERRRRSLEEMAEAVKAAQNARRRSSLKQTEEDLSFEDDASQEERARNVAKQARQKTKKYEQPSEDSLEEEDVVVGLLRRLAHARELAAEARELVEEAQNMSVHFEFISDQQEIFETLAQLEAENQPPSANDRREARKVLDLARSIAEVEQNRLPSSSRKTILRMVKELDEQIQGPDGQTVLRLALQLANRLFETIRRDMRPW